MRSQRNATSRFSSSDRSLLRARESRAIIGKVIRVTWAGTPMHTDTHTVCGCSIFCDMQPRPLTRSGNTRFRLLPLATVPCKFPLETSSTSPVAVFDIEPSPRLCTPRATWKVDNDQKEFVFALFTCYFGGSKCEPAGANNPPSSQLSFSLVHAT